MLGKHTVGIDVERNALLDAYEELGRDDLRALAGALVTPMATKLSDRDGGREYLQINAQLVNRPDIRIDERESRGASGAGESSSSRSCPSRRSRRCTIASLRSASARPSSPAAGKPRHDDLLFTSHLIDLITALLAAPVSAETGRLLRKRG